VRSPEAAKLREALARAEIEADGHDHTLFAHGTTTERVGEIAAAAGVVLHELRTEESSLEEVFLELTAERPQ
jgi:ABC-2 type transport system ATP-binding protein